MLGWMTRVVPDGLLGRHPDDATERRRNRRAVERAQQVVDAWNQRQADGVSLRRERIFWQEHGGQGK